jgi:hypothetical protein
MDIVNPKKTCGVQAKAKEKCLRPTIILGKTINNWIKN